MKTGGNLNAQTVMHEMSDNNSPSSSHLKRVQESSHEVGVFSTPAEDLHMKHRTGQTSTHALRCDSDQIRRSDPYLKLWTEAVEERLSRPIAVAAHFERVRGERSEHLRV